MSRILIAVTLLCACVYRGEPVGGGGGDPYCAANDCTCPLGATCEHDCVAGSMCLVRAEPGARVNVTCTATDLCEVECFESASCFVDCAGRADCQVTCPTDNCTVINLPPNDPAVTCGGVDAPTRTGTTTTCP